MMPTREFQPSTESMTPVQRTKAMLQYVKKASEVIDAYMDEHGEVPPWVFEKILQSAQHMGMAVSFVRRSPAPKAEGPGRPARKKTR